MILVDTSILIDFLRGGRNLGVARFDEILERRLPYGITQFTYQEILQGAASEKEFRLLQTYLDTLVFYGLKEGLKSFSAAARIYFRCRQKGVTVRSAVDCLIAQVAIEQGLQLLHHDVDFTRMATVIKELKIF